MTYKPARTPGPDEKFTVREMAHDEVPHWFHAYSRKPPYTTNTALGFNRGWGSTRFAPIKNSDGSNIHTYYAASTREGAYMESVLHDIPLGVPAFFDKTQLETWHLAKIRLKSPIKFVSFHSNFLPALGLTRQQLIDSLPADYPLTRPWAAAAFAQCPDAQAIGYTSRRNDAARCLMLIEQRLPSPPFDIIEDDCIGTSAVLRREVLDLVDSLGVSVL
jgi:hypothetical protein